METKKIKHTKLGLDGGNITPMPAHDPSGKMKQMAKLEKSYSSVNAKPKKAEVDYNAIGARNSHIDKIAEQYDKQEEKQKLNLGENSMYTGNAWFDIGLALGRKYGKKKKG